MISKEEERERGISRGSRSVGNGGSVSGYAPKIGKAEPMEEGGTSPKGRQGYQ